VTVDCLYQLLVHCQPCFCVGWLINVQKIVLVCLCQMALWQLQRLVTVIGQYYKQRKQDSLSIAVTNVGGNHQSVIEYMLRI